MKYAILKDEHHGYLCELVNKAIAYGWQPFGSPFVKGNEIHQAVVMIEEAQPAKPYMSGFSAN